MRTMLRTCVLMVACVSATCAVAQQPRPPGNDPFSQGKFEEAEQSFRAALEKNPGDARALAGLARAALFDDKVDEAINLADKALAISPGDPVATRTRMIALERKAAFGPDTFNFTLDRPVAIKFDQIDPLPVVSVTIGTRQAKFLLDTGGPNVTVTRALAEELGLPLTDGPMGTFAGGRQARTQRTLIPEFALGSLKISNVPAGVLELGGMPVDGIIGSGLLMHFLSTIDYCNGELILAPRADSATFQQQASATGANVGRMWLMGDHFILTRARFNDAPEGIFMVDTGFAGGGLLGTREALEEAGIEIDASKVVTGIGGGGAVQGIPFVASATWGNLTRDNITGRYNLGGGQFGIFPFRMNGMLSHQFFRTSRLTFDFETMRMVTQECI
ncbi:MAG: aspartyl protease family protein [Gammaproteobacteria bacterium]|nr:aspartyl protease family protein [Gammaproteobacteria bacterium]